MNSVKSKLIIISFFVFITFQDIYASYCIDSLGRAGYHLDENYLTHYLKFFKSLNANGDYENYEFRVQYIVHSCNAYENSRKVDDNISESLSISIGSGDKVTINQYEDSISIGSEWDSESSSSEEHSPLKSENESSEDGLKLDLSKNEQFNIVQPEGPKQSKQLSTDHLIETFFTCDILKKIYDSLALKNVEEWCELMKNHIQNDRYSFKDCLAELKKSGFIFKHGIDNYAYSIIKWKKKTEDEENIHEIDTTNGVEENKGRDVLQNEFQKTERARPKFGEKIHGENITKKRRDLLQNGVQRAGNRDMSQDGVQSDGDRDKIRDTVNPIQNTLDFKGLYLKYLEAEIDKRSMSLDNTATWCSIWLCEEKLLKNGFDNRVTGSENLTVVKIKYGGVCTHLLEDSQEYCHDLLNNTSETKLLETPKWCSKKYGPMV